MNLYALSRGREKRLDYRWIALSPDGAQTAVAEPPAECCLDRLRRWMPPEGLSTAPSFALGRFGGSTILLMQDIPAQSRRDFRQRTIDDTLLLAADSKEEDILRGILARALSEPEWLPTWLDTILAFDSELGFRLAPDTLASLQTLRPIDSGEPFLTPQSTCLTEETRRALGEELRAYRLPPSWRMLVVVTNYLSPQALLRAKVWRGLADGVIDILPRPHFWQFH